MMLPTRLTRPLKHDPLKPDLLKQDLPKQAHRQPQQHHRLWRVWRWGGLVLCWSWGAGLLPIGSDWQSRDLQPRSEILSGIWSGISSRQPAIAVTARQELTLETYLGESFAQLLQRAEEFAQMETDAQFSQDITISQVSLVVMGVNDGLRSPLLSLDVSRSAWRSRSDIRQHARYYTDARALLNLPLSETSTSTGTPASSNSTGTTPGTTSGTTSGITGSGTGSQSLTVSDLQITLHWNGTDDLNLVVSEPTGEIISALNPAVPSGGSLDLQANTDCQLPVAKPIEHVGWSTDRAPTGHYIATVHLANRCNAAQTEPITFTLTVQTPTGTRSWDGQVSEAQRYRAFPFTFN